MTQSALCCRFRELDLCVSMVEPAKDRMCNNISKAFNRTRVGSIVRERNVRYSEDCDCALASNSAAAFAALNVSAVPLVIRSSRLLLALALRRTSQVGTPSCVKTNNINSPASVQTAGLGHRAGSGCHSMSAMRFAHKRHRAPTPFAPPILSRPVTRGLSRHPSQRSSSPAISLTRSTMRRLRLASLSRMNALVSASPSRVARKSDT